jgi:hypothetical protein
MSNLPISPSIWTPDTIANVVYRVVMIAVSLAFIWKQYHRSARSLDGESSAILPLFPQRLSTTDFLYSEEHIIGILVPNNPSKSNDAQSAQSIIIPHPNKRRSLSLLKELLATQLESIIQLALGDGDTDERNSPSVSINISTDDRHKSAKSSPGSEHRV